MRQLLVAYPQLESNFNNFPSDLINSMIRRHSQDSKRSPFFFQNLFIYQFKLFSNFFILFKIKPHTGLPFKMVEREDHPGSQSRKPLIKPLGSSWIFLDLRWSLCLLEFFVCRQVSDSKVDQG